MWFRLTKETCYLSFQKLSGIAFKLYCCYIYYRYHNLVMKRLVMCINSSYETVLLEQLSIIVKVNFYGGFSSTLSENCT